MVSNVSHPEMVSVTMTLYVPGRMFCKSSVVVPFDQRNEVLIEGFTMRSIVPLLAPQLAGMVVEERRGDVVLF